MTSEPGEQEPEERDAPREHVGAVLGVLLGLLLLVGSLLGILAVRHEEVDAEERLTAILGEAPLVFGLELSDASRLPTREVVLKLERSAGEPADQNAEGDEALPIEVVLIEFPKPEAALAAFRGQPSELGGEGPQPSGPGRGPRSDQGGGSRGASATLMRWEENPDFPWHTAIERDEVSWGRWRADYCIERSFLVGGSWRDSARVNLSQKGRNLILFARWPDETEVPMPVLRELLRSVHMLDAENESEPPA